MSTGSELIQRLRALQDSFQSELTAATAEHHITHLKAQYVGKQGQVSEILKGLKDLSTDERPEVGQVANEVKQQITAQCKSAISDLKTQKQGSVTSLDPTLPGRFVSRGSRHPLSLCLNDVQALLQSMGFQVHTGPQLETDFYNFEALNIPSNHPARDMQDTFYLDPNFGGLLLRTHTSPVQIHVMKDQQPPLQIIAPGPVYRRDSDVSHTPMFHQIEGLYVDHEVSFSHLRGVLDAFVQAFFGADVVTRFRPSYFPFTEPSAEVDISCVICPDRKADGSGVGCRVCSHTGWLEVMGSGMVHPQVLRAVDLDPEEWSGFAFGMGIERLAMLKYRITDIRLFYENDRRFLEQFS